MIGESIKCDVMWWYVQCESTMIHEATILNNEYTIHGMLQFVALWIDYLTQNYRTPHTDCASPEWQMATKKKNNKAE